jgi:hypothetical protein
MKSSTTKTTYIYTKDSMPKYIQVKQGETFKLVHIKDQANYGKVIIKGEK